MFGSSGLHAALEAVVALVMILLLLNLAWLLLLRIAVPLGICAGLVVLGAGAWRRYRDW
jgi:hypothetical protein